MTETVCLKLFDCIRLALWMSGSGHLEMRPTHPHHLNNCDVRLVQHRRREHIIRHYADHNACVVLGFQLAVWLAIQLAVSSTQSARLACARIGLHIVVLHKHFCTFARRPYSGGTITNALYMGKWNGNRRLYGSAQLIASPNEFHYEPCVSAPPDTRGSDHYIGRSAGV